MNIYPSLTKLEWKRYRELGLDHNPSGIATPIDLATNIVGYGSLRQLLESKNDGGYELLEDEDENFFRDRLIRRRRHKSDLVDITVLLSGLGSGMDAVPVAFCLKWLEECERLHPDLTRNGLWTKELLRCCHTDYCASVEMWFDANEIPALHKGVLDSALAAAVHGVAGPFNSQWSLTQRLAFMACRLYDVFCVANPALVGTYDTQSTTLRESSRPIETANFLYYIICETSLSWSTHRARSLGCLGFVSYIKQMAMRLFNRMQLPRTFISWKYRTLFIGNSPPVVTMRRPLRPPPFICSLAQIGNATKSSSSASSSSSSWSDPTCNTTPPPPLPLSLPPPLAPSGWRATTAAVRRSLQRLSLAAAQAPPPVGGSSGSTTVGLTAARSSRNRDLPIAIPESTIQNRGRSSHRSESGSGHRSQSGSRHRSQSRRQNLYTRPPQSSPRSRRRAKDEERRADEEQAVFTTDDTCGLMNENARLRVWKLKQKEKKKQRCEAAAWSSEEEYPDKDDAAFLSPIPYR